MTLSTYSPALLLLFVTAMLWIMMDIHYRDLTPAQRWLAPAVIAALAVLNHVLRARAGVSANRLMWLTMHLPFFLLFLYITKCGVIKMAFMILSAFIFTAPTIIAGSLAVQHFPDSPWTLLVSDLLSYAVILLLVQLVFRRGFNYLIRYGSNRLFLQFLLVPFLYYVYVFAALNVDFSSVTASGGTFVRYFPTLEVLVFYLLLLEVYRRVSERRDMEAAQAALAQQLDAAEVQIAHLNEAQTQTAVYQHDMRHHMTAIEAFLSAGNVAQAEEYIRKVQSDVAAIAAQRFCENELVNLLCSSFSEKARRASARLEVDVHLPKALPISDTELCSLLSNALENALTAVSALPPEQRVVTLYGAIRHDRLLVEVTNPYAGEVVMRGGCPVSDRAGHGYGCRSIQTIAQRHGGLCEFRAENGRFRLMAALPAAPVERAAK